MEIFVFFVGWMGMQWMCEEFEDFVFEVLNLEL